MMKNNNKYIVAGLVNVLVFLCLSSCKKVEPKVVPSYEDTYINVQHSGTNEHLRSVHFFDINNGIVMGASGGVYNTADGGLTWDVTNPLDLDTPLEIDSDTSIVFTKMFFLNQTGWIFGNLRFGSGRNPPIIKSFFLTTVNGGEDWETKDFLDLIQINSINFIDPLKGYIVGNAGIIYNTTDGGNHWIEQVSGVSIDLQSIATINQNTVFVVGLSGTLLKTTDGGITWLQIETFEGRAFKNLQFYDGSNGYVTGGGHNSPNDDKAFVYKIDINGNLENVTNPYYSVYYFYGFYVAKNGTDVWAAGHLGQIYRTHDGGTTWSDELSKSKREETLNDISFPAENIGYFVGNGGGNFKSNNRWFFPTYWVF